MGLGQFCPAQPGPKPKPHKGLPPRNGGKRAVLSSLVSGFGTDVTVLATLLRHVVLSGERATETLVSLQEIEDHFLILVVPVRSGEQATNGNTEAMSFSDG